MRVVVFASMCAALAVGSGCGAGSAPESAARSTAPELDEVATERAKLSPDDRTLVEAQEWCVISTDERLGSMGPPLKLDIKGQPVFVCCKSCKRKAEADPEKTLATLAAHKAKKGAASPAP